MKTLLPVISLAFLAMAAVIVPASGQTVYRCGSVYSQQPCSGAIPVDVSDSRTPAQKAEADAAVVQTAKSATSLEKDRLAWERSQAAILNKKLPKTGQAAKADAAGQKGKPGAKQKKKEPEYFTAAIAQEKKEKKSAKKSSEPADTAKASKTSQVSKL